MIATLRRDRVREVSILCLPNLKEQKEKSVHANCQYMHEDTENFSRFQHACTDRLHFGRYVSFTCMVLSLSPALLRTSYLYRSLLATTNVDVRQHAWVCRVPEF